MKNDVVKPVEVATESAKSADKAVKAEVKAVTKKAEGKEVAKTTAKKTEVKKTTTKETAKKPAAKKTTTTKKTTETMTACKVYIQLPNVEIVAEDVMNKVLEVYKAEGNKAKAKSVNLYIKPEENAAYYVINDSVAGKVDIF